jgi:FdrA protein
VPVEYLSVSDAYQDSVKLMQVSTEVADSFAVDRAVAMMGTDENKRMLAESELLDESSLAEFDPNDLILAVRDDDPEQAAAALDEMEASIRGGQGRPVEEVDSGERTPRSVSTAIDRLPDANLALVSVPGEYAVREAWKSLHEGLHVHIFSDNVGLDDESELKSFGREHGRLVMGPDCGSAIVDGVPLGFANEVREGSVGVVSAAGTGLQAVTSLVDRAGAGISQAIGTGGRDLQDAVGGIATQQGLEMLSADDGTEVIVLISKPPGSGTVDDVLGAVSDCPKPVVVEFVGGDPDPIEDAGGVAAETLAEAAGLAVSELPDGESAADVTFDEGTTGLTDPDRAGEAVADRSDPGENRQYVRGLYTGGTLCSEAVALLADRVDDVSSNAGIGAALEDPLAPDGHAVVDLGADEFTQGRPHPMIDSTVRDEQLRRTVESDDALVVLLDVVLGYGAHPDPAGSVVEVLAEADHGDWPVVVASVCGTREDPQDWGQQVDALADAGVCVAGSNADAVRLAGNVIAQARTSGGDPA